MANQMQSKVNIALKRSALYIGISPRWGHLDEARQHECHPSRSPLAPIPQDQWTKSAWRARMPLWPNPYDYSPSSSSSAPLNFKPRNRLLKSDEGEADWLTGSGGGSGPPQCWKVSRNFSRPGQHQRRWHFPAAAAWDLHACA
mmetsp:Transcript_63741/g.164525  ORF Transcript_63741/g.164525 Transcript_63741/m.164525 type:complete len:143 (+) Transcript_63741:14-442(+)